MGLYKVTSPRAVLDVEPGDTLEHDFTAAEEADLVAARRLEILPSEYLVIGPSEVYGAKPGETFKAALTVHEAQLLEDAGHVERAAKKQASKPKADKDSPKKNAPKEPPAAQASATATEQKPPADA